MPDILTATVTWDGRRAQVKLEGELDAETAGYADRLLVGLVEAGATEIGIDAESITFIDAAGANVLLAAWRRAALQIDHPSLRLTRVLELIGLEDLLISVAQRKLDRPAPAGAAKGTDTSFTDGAHGKRVSHA